jgi:DNA-binding MarR family transcriptional regulator
MSSQLRQAPLLDRDRDKALFVLPEDFDRVSWSVRQGFNVLILGDRGQGKTSVLHQLELDLRQEQPDRHITFVDLAGADSGEVALRLLVSGAADAMGQLLAWAPPLPRPNEPDEERNIRAALDQLMALEACTFFIDNLNARDVGFPLFGVLRDRLWETPHQWIVAGQKADRRWLLRPPADAFWEQVIELEYSADAAHELLERRLKSRPSWIVPMVESVGTNPRRLLRAALAAIHDDEQPENVVQTWEDWQKRLASLDRRSSMLMAELSGRPPVSASDPELLRSLGWARTSLLKTLESLEKQGLVESWNESAGTGRPRRLFTATEPGKPGRG